VQRRAYLIKSKPASQAGIPRVSRLGTEDDRLSGEVEMDELVTLSDRDLEELSMVEEFEAGE
jgi:hypothetical protein